MHLPPFDPAAVHVEDQRNNPPPEEEGVVAATLRGIGNNWRRGGLLGLFGMSTPPPARTLDGRHVVITPDLVRSPLPQLFRGMPGER